MGVRNASATSNVIINTAPANGVETILATTGAIGLVQDNAQVMLMYQLIVTTGVGATSLQVALRRGAAVASTLVNVRSSIACAASSIVLLSGCYSDLPGVAANLQYTLTIQVNGGAAALGMNDVFIAAFVL